MNFALFQGHLRKSLTPFHWQEYKLPLLRPGFGNGKWQPFIAGTSQTTVIRVKDSDTLNLYFPPIRREVYFNTKQTSEIGKCYHSLRLLHRP